MQAPQSLFLFNSFRDDAKGLQIVKGFIKGTMNRIDPVKGFSKGTTGRICGFKLYQKLTWYSDLGYLISTKKPDDLVTGRIVQFENVTDFKAALRSLKERRTQSLSFSKIPIYVEIWTVHYLLNQGIG